MLTYNMCISPHLNLMNSLGSPFSSVQFSRSVESDSLQPHESQHARPPCPSPTPRVYSNSCPSSQWCHPVISSSVVPFSSCPQCLPASGSFPMSQLFAWGGQSIGVSVSASVLPMSTQDWFPLGWTGWISLQSKRLSRVFSNTQFKSNNSEISLLYGPTLTSIHEYWKTIALTRWTFVSKLISMLFNMLPGFLIAFLPSSKCSATILPKHFFTLAWYKLSTEQEL